MSHREGGPIRVVRQDRDSLKIRLEGEAAGIGCRLADQLVKGRLRRRDKLHWLVRDAGRKTVIPLRDKIPVDRDINFEPGLLRLRLIRRNPRL